MVSLYLACARNDSDIDNYRSVFDVTDKDNNANFEDLDIQYH